MLRKIIAVATALLLAAGIGTAMVGAADAHAGKIKAEAICNVQTGKYDVTYTLTWDNVPASGGALHYRLGETNFISNWTYPGGKDWQDVSITTAQGQKTWGESIPGTSTSGPWTYAYIEWNDGYNQQKVFDTRVEGLKGDCTKPSTEVLPTNPIIVDECGTTSDSITLAADGGGITYTKSGGYAVASLEDGYAWGSPTPSGWTADGATLKYKLPTLSSDPCSHTEEVCWTVDGYTGTTPPPDGAESTFPQTRVDCDDVIPCGVWVQKDTYVIDTAAKETVWENLGDTLEWVGKTHSDPGHAEDASIYKSHVFLHGKECEKPPVEVCELATWTKKSVSQAEYDAHKDLYTAYDSTTCQPPKIHICVWDESTKAPTDVEVLPSERGGAPLYKDGSECTPLVHVCEYNDGTAQDVTYPEGQVPEGAIPWEDGSECTPPPPVHVCEYKDGKANDVTYPAGQVPADAIPWEDGSECTPPTDVCVNIDGVQTEVPAGYDVDDNANCTTPPTLEGTVFAAECVDDVPWIVYNVKLNNPFGNSTDDGNTYFTMTAPGSTEQATWTFPLTDNGDGTKSASGRFLWPGASATDNGDGTYTATGWPGWAFVDDEWISTGDDNYGWTRDGANMHIKVNPEMDVHLNYPPPTKDCVAGPPKEISKVLDAPPAKAVEAEAQYAG